MHPMLNTAIKAARAAGRIIIRHLADLDRLTVETKGRNDFVSQVDRRAEDEIIRIVHRAYPDHAIFAEESGAHAGSEYEWIIDPLDGTTNFLHGYPQFSVSIALHQRGRPLVAVVFDPLRDELFTAARGDGARLNDRRIRVSHVINMDGALLGTGFPYKSMDFLDAWVATFRELLPRTSGVRRAGSAALDLAHVASGRLDGFWEFGLNRWDIAAGALLIEESGGLVTDFRGEDGHFASGNILAGNPRIHAEMLRLLPPLLPAALKS